MALIRASQFNAIADLYNDALGISLPHVEAGDKITASQWKAMHDAVRAAALAQSYTVNLPDPASFIRGRPIRLEQWGVPVPIVPDATTLLADYNGSLIIPPNVTTVMVNWLVAGGGAGGSGTNYGYGGGGGGGGSAGFARYVTLSVQPGDRLVWTIGQGGSASGGGTNQTYANGGNGGDTVLLRNSQEVLRVRGGNGGRTATPANSQAMGGVGGQEGGLQGQTGQSGTGEFTPSFGGGGAPGPMATSFGGAGGSAGSGGDYVTGGSAGRRGVGFGSGGGGGGCADRGQGISGGHYWSGGDGAKGCIEICYPSRGETGGTLAQDNSGYVVNPSTPGGSYTGGTTPGGGWTGPGGDVGIV